MSHRPYPRADRARHQLARHRHQLPQPFLSSGTTVADLTIGAEYLGRLMRAVSVAPAELDRAIAVERYYSGAAAIGVTREQANECLRSAQGREAGSSPTIADLNTATTLMKALPV